MKTLKLGADLPDELILKILSYLPAICLIKCTIVCKSWYSLIKSLNFISTHLTVSRNRNPPFLIARIDICGDEQFSLHIDDKDFTKYMSVLNPSITDRRIEVLGSCNGILCLSCLIGRAFCLWNPSIRKHIMLPTPISNQMGAYFGFGFDSSTNSYKVFRMCYGKSPKAELYSSNLGSWKELTEIAPFYNFNITVRRFGAFVNGALHWVVNRGDEEVGFQSVVMAFDLKDENFHEIMLPDCLVHVSSTELTLMVYPKSSIAVVKSNYDSDSGFYSEIWIMKEYGVVNSWEKFDVGKNGWAFGFVNNGQQVLMDALHQRSEDLVSQPHENVIHNVKGWFHFSYHVESLLLLEK